MTALYWGESARTGFKRGLDHVEGLKRECEKAPLWRHAQRFHEGEKEETWYQMKVVRSHKSPLTRQVDEGVEIAMCDAKIVMNSKGEWNGSRLPRMVIERGEQIELDKDDINIRMMNWEVKSGQEGSKSKQQKRKTEAETVNGLSDSESDKTEPRTKRIRIAATAVRNEEEKVDTKVQKVTKCKITSYFSSQERKTEVQDVQSEVVGAVDAEEEEGEPDDVQEGLEVLQGRIGTPDSLTEGVREVEGTHERISYFVKHPVDCQEVQEKEETKLDPEQTEKQDQMTKHEAEENEKELLQPQLEDQVTGKEGRLIRLILDDETEFVDKKDVLTCSKRKRITEKNYTSREEITEEEITEERKTNSKESEVRKKELEKLEQEKEEIEDRDRKEEKKRKKKVKEELDRENEEEKKRIKKNIQDEIDRWNNWAGGGAARQRKQASLTECTPNNQSHKKNKTKKKEEELRNTEGRRIEKRKKKNQGSLPQEKKPQIQLNVKEMMKKFEEKKEPVEKVKSRVRKMVEEWNEKDE